MSRYLLEICVDTASGLRAAVAHGADRIELCDALAVGGLTPSAGLMRLAADIGVPTRVMIRPRAGDFTYSADDLAIMRHDIEVASRYGLKGVVFGANHADGTLDVEVLSDLIAHARTLKLETALHRSFDLAPDPAAALDAVVTLGFDTVLTSGGAATAADGVATLRALVQQAAGRLEILAGGGVTAANAASILATGVRALHASCAGPLPVLSPRAALLGYVTPDQRDTDPVRVKALRDALVSCEVPHVVC